MSSTIDCDLCGAKATHMDLRCEVHGIWKLEALVTELKEKLAYYEQALPRASSLTDAKVREPTEPADCSEAPAPSASDSDPELTCEVDLDDLLGLVACAEDYGFGHSMFYAAMGEWSGPVSNAEIEAYIATSLPEVDGYGARDVENARQRLTEWRDRYARANG